MTGRDVQDLVDYLNHIRQAIGRIRRYVSGLDREAFFQNEEKQDAVIHS